MVHKSRYPPDYACQACGYLFRESLSQRVLRLRKSKPALLQLPRCPKCGSRNVAALTY